MPVFYQDPKIERGAANILTFDSVDEMNATTAPDGTIALVPCEGESGGGGLPVVELTTPITAEAAFTEAENEALTAAYENGLPVVLKCNLNYTGTTVDGGGVEIIADNFKTTAFTCALDGMNMIAMNFGVNIIMLCFIEGAWLVMLQ